MQKTYDLAVVVGTYQKGGETKKKYRNVGAVMEGDNGPFILLDRTFNPAGIEADGRESILISCFTPREREEAF